VPPSRLNGAVLSSLLIANRGEIARRIIRTARRMGLRTIAVATEGDRSWPHWREADEAVFIGEGSAADSYLSIAKVIEAARRTGAEAVHPGYGFLAESAAFAEACAAAGLVFVGPPAEAIRAMGDKAEAKALMERAGVPVVPGYHGERQEPEFLKRKAWEIGYPVLIKAVAGGGGRGLRRVERVADFDGALESARREAAAAFGDERVLIERLVARPRHVEVQVFADNHGNIVHMHERDCSVQRRHQKVIEEAPAPGMSEAARRAMSEAAVAAARAVGYRGAGTVELIAGAEGGLRPDAFFFMEMNTRLQVEHPVTEAVTGLDLVEWQLRIAAGEPLRLAQGDIRLAGHAVEARIYAEEPAAGFAPSTGRLWAADFPAGDGIRVDSGVTEGAVVSSFYDSLLAKVIAHGADRAEALTRLSAALAATRLAGPQTNLSFLAAILRHPEFQNGGVDTGFVERNLEALTATRPARGLAVAAVGEWLRREARTSAAGASGPWADTGAFEVAGIERRSAVALTIDGEPATAHIVWRAGDAEIVLEGEGGPVPPDDGEPEVIWAEGEALVLAGSCQLRVAFPDAVACDPTEAAGQGSVAVPMSGRIVGVAVQPGDAVAKGDPLVVLEAMKMEHTLSAPFAGRVEAVLVSPGEQVRQGQVAARIVPNA
jgi:3-methylcrotonyl-CoA carboxylase alpha subunit